jgi:hypothetical protein
MIRSSQKWMPVFQLRRSRLTDDLGVFAPKRPAPANPVPLEELERLIASLADTSLN